MPHRLFPLAALAPIAAIPAFAQPDAPLRWEARSYVERISRDLNGRERRMVVPAQRLSPGDRLIFVLDYRNAGNSPLDGAALTSPVSRHVMLEAPDRPVEVSVDGGRSWGRLGHIRLPSGLGGTRIATTQDVTHVRWAVPPVPPGGSGRLSYRATVR